MIFIYTFDYFSIKCCQFIFQILNNFKIIIRCKNILYKYSCVTYIKIIPLKQNYIKRHISNAFP